MSRKIVIGITGASGSIYAKNLIAKLNSLSSSHDIQVDLVFTKNAVDVWKYELEENPLEIIKNKVFNHDDYYAPFASGSSSYDTLIVCPCTMGTVGRIAAGISTDLISRAADVMLKENRKLIIVPRESPYNLIHLKNLVTLKEAGATIIPASPSFYSKPKNIDELVDTIVNRIIGHIGIETGAIRWNE